MSWWRIPPTLSWFTLFRAWKHLSMLPMLNLVFITVRNCKLYLLQTYALLSISCLALILYFVDQVVYPVNNSVPKLLKRLVSQVFQVPKRKYKVWLHNCYIICVKDYFQSSVRGTSGQSPDLCGERMPRKSHWFSQKIINISVETYLVNIHYSKTINGTCWYHDLYWTLSLKEVPGLCQTHCK